jgi:hypothetical protein
MRSLTLATAACMAFTLTANAETISGGKVTAVNEGARSFEYHWKGKDWTFRTNDKTLFRVRNQNVAFSDLRPGDAVSVTFHRDANGRVAEQVTAIIVGIGF